MNSSDPPPPASPADAGQPSASQPAAGATAAARSALPPAVQQRLQQVFQHATRSFEKGDCDYAHDLYTQCVTEDPGNLLYIQHFRANLTKRSGAGKKSSSFGGLLGKTGRGPVDKAIAKGKWQEAFAAGCQALKKNAGDIGVLLAMASAAKELRHVECQLYYLRWALDIDSTAVETNRQAAAALAEIGEFDQAIACWQRVLQQKPLDEEATKQISRLSVEKTIHVGGYKAEVQSEDGSADTLATSRVANLAAKESDGTPRKPSDSTVIDSTDEDFATGEKRLLAAIAAAPADPANYATLATHYADVDRLQDAERLLKQALAVASAKDAPSSVAAMGDKLRQQLEDIHLRRVRQQVELAQKRVATQDNEESRDLLRRMTDQANRAELEVYAARAERSPGDTRQQFELGLRQKRMGQFREAIKSFQAARGDSQRLGETQILLGECFQHIEQYKLAMSSYEAAVEASAGILGGAKEEVRKLALYRTGVLAMGLKEYDRAEQRLTELAGLDFSYRDVADRLDKVAAMRKDT